MQPLPYQLLDSGEGRKLERFGEFVLDRPDPQIIWHKTSPEIWGQANAIFDSSWRKKAMPASWQIAYEGLTLELRLTSFKHTGLFPEQIEQFKWLQTQQPENVLNLFGYTGVAALICAKAGAKVTYVDASKPSLTWARKNQTLSGFGDKPIRWICDDAIKFVAREIKRGQKFDAIIMDPPVYGHGPQGEVWDFNTSLPQLLDLCRQVLAPKAKFVLVNAYAVTTSSLTLKNVLDDLMMGHRGQITHGELILGDKISTGIFGKWCATL